jgi:aminopeptidase N
MLRNITGDDALKQALQAYRLDPKLDRDPEGLQHTLEKFSHKDLTWFFDNWVYEDRGLPDLSIVNVTPRQLEAHSGLPAGWLVSVDVRNDGDAEAEVPITVRSAPGLSAGANAATETQTLRIPGHASISRRIVFASTPAEVQVNDGSVPETRTSIHTRQLTLPAR